MSVERIQASWIAGESGARSRPGAGPVRVLWLVALVGLAPASEARADLSSADQQLATYLVSELGYADTARRLVDELEKKYTDPEARASLAWLRVDILNLEGKNEEAIELAERNKQLYPKHPRASLADLQSISAAMSKVMNAFELANTKLELAEQYRKKGKELFYSDVKKPLDALIADVNQKVDALVQRYSEALDKDPQATEPEELSKLRRNRDHVELVRIRTLRVYAGLLPESDEAFAEEREKILREGLGHAEQYVQLRAKNFLYQWQAQLQKGRYRAALGDCDQAYRDLRILVGIRPPGMRAASAAKLPADLVKFMKKLHIEALLYAARAANCAGKYSEAANLVQSKMIEDSRGPFALADAQRDPDLETFYVLALLERAVALAGKGDADQGLDLVQQIIQRYESSFAPKAKAYVIDARKALGQIAEVSGARLSAEDYFEGAMGLYSQLSYDEAISLFLRALEATTPEDRDEVAPRALDKLGEISYLLENYAQATIAYLDIVRNFRQSDAELVKKAARNALSAATKLTQTVTGAHSGYNRLREEARVLLNEVAPEGPSIWQDKMVEAGKQEELGHFLEAATIYKEIPREVDGEPLPFYWRAQAKYVDALYQDWAQKVAGQEPDEAQLEKLAKLTEAFEKILEGATEAGQPDGAVIAAFDLGQIYTELKEWEKAREALRPFLDRFAGDPQYGAAGLYYLVDASLRAEDADTAEQAFQVLRQNYPEHQTAYFSSLFLMEHFRREGESGKAADYILAWANHPRAKQELDDVGRLMDIVDVLLEAGRVDEAATWLARAEGMIDEADAEARKRVLYRTAALAYERKEYDVVKDRLTAYIQENGLPKASEKDGPFILRMLGDALFQIYHKPGAPARTKNLETAARLYIRAFKMMRQRMADDPEGPWERYYWQWAYKALLIKRYQGLAGDPQAWTDILVFLKQKEGESMGGPELKRRFEKLGAEAQARVK